MRLDYAHPFFLVCRSLFGLALCSLVGCANTSGVLPGSHDGGGAQCNSDVDCARGLHCDTTAHACVACRNDSDCPIGELCSPTQHECVLGCSAGRGCGDAGVCETDAGLCVQCRVDSDCPLADPHCQSNVCVPCLPTDDTCPLGTYCVQQGNSFVCQSGCKNDNDCNPADAGLNGDGGAAPIGHCDVSRHTCVNCAMDSDCPVGEVCTNGLCSNGCNANHGCPAGMGCCGGACIDTTSNNQNCGACGNACSGGWTCCQSTCSNPVNDVQNCGACGHVCNPKNGTGACVNRSCTIGQCNAGYADCNGVYMDGCETDTNSNINNCGSCNNPCSLQNVQVPSCNNGTCGVNVCASGWGDCDHDPTNGCEKNIAGNDNNNCGACGRVCAPNNASGNCVNGVCTITACNAGFMDCNNSAVDGCEANLASDPNNCGRCGNACSNVNGTPSCSNGNCQITCNAGWGNCDNNPANGCEVNTAGDVNNCGACNMRCALANATTQQCSNGACSVVTCASGWGDCDGFEPNGCEANTTSDPANCGGCHNVCPGSGLPTDDPYCSNSQCGLTCRGENYDVNNNPADGCEIPDPNPPGPEHSMATANYLGSKECTDSTSMTTVTGLIPSDSRVHNPAVESFNASVGAAPDYFSAFATGSCTGFLCTCINDYGVMVKTSGGGSSQCYQVTLITDKGNYSMTVSGNGTNSMSGGDPFGGIYDNNTYVYVVMEKICSLPVQEDVSYTITFHL